MDRLTTDNPQGNFETAMNYVYDKDREAYILHDGRAANVPLWQYIDRLCEEKGCEVGEPKSSEETSWRCFDCAMDGDGCAVAMMYVFASQAVEHRGRLKRFENNGQTPEEQAAMIAENAALLKRARYAEAEVKRLCKAITSWGAVTQERIITRAEAEAAMEGKT